MDTDVVTELVLHSFSCSDQYIHTTDLPYHSPSPVFVTATIILDSRFASALPAGVFRVPSSTKNLFTKSVRYERINNRCSIAPQGGEAKLYLLISIQ